MEEREERNKHLWSTYALMGLLLITTFSVITVAEQPLLKWYVNGTRFAMDINGSLAIGQNPVKNVDLQVNGTFNLSGYGYYNNSEICTAANGLCGGGSDTNETARVNTIINNLIPSLNATKLENGTDAQFTGLNVTGVTYHGDLINMNSTGSAKNITGVNCIIFHNGGEWCSA